MLYENNMCKQVGKVLSCDHTFKTSKHVGVTREDDSKFVRQFEIVFLALNENGKVMAKLWPGDLQNPCRSQKFKTC